MIACALAAGSYTVCVLSGTATSIKAPFLLAVYAGCAAALAFVARARRAERRAWALLAIAAAGYGLSASEYALDPRAAELFPSYRDAGLFLFYPLAVAGFVALIRARQVARANSLVWVDAAGAGLVLAAVGMQFLSKAHPAAPAAAAVFSEQALYVIGDLVFAGFIAAASALNHWRGGRAFGLLAAGSGLLATADLSFAASPRLGEAAAVAAQILWPWAMIAVAAAGLPRVEIAEPRETPLLEVLAIPAGSVVFAAILLVGQSHSGPLSGELRTLCAAALLAAVVRFSLTVATNTKLLAQARRQGMHDELTQLPNRGLLLDRAAHALEGIGRDCECVALLFLDLDGFKLLNDSFGHAEGDKVLRQVARRLAAALRPTDTVGRLAGDEFVGICCLHEADEALFVAERLARAVAEPMTLDGEAISISASVGIAVTSKPDYGAENLLAEADTAMYRAKRRGRGIELYGRDPEESPSKRLQLALELRRAVANEDLTLAFQPIFHIPSGQISEVEPLVRWKHPVLGPVSPGIFIRSQRHSA